MNEYTAEDFKNAMFAEHKHGSKAVRWEMNYRVPWHTGIGDRFSDEQMAENGWRPVVEARITEHTLRDLRDLRHDLALARKERDRLAQNLRRSYGQPKGNGTLTLDTLREAWANGEQVTIGNPAHEGDVIIAPNGAGTGYIVRLASHIWEDSDFRVLHRAPQPPPWQALADEMEELYDGYSLRAAEAAQFLHERGVRVVGGDES